jgi:hypothetical protein
LPSETPHVGIFWLAQTTEDEARLLASGYPIDQTEYGDCLTYGAGQHRKFQLSLSYIEGKSHTKIG